jgi:hypothetical protein
MTTLQNERNETLAAVMSVGVWNMFVNWSAFFLRTGVSVDFWRNVSFECSVVAIYCIPFVYTALGNNKFPISEKFMKSEASVLGTGMSPRVSSFGLTMGDCVSK